MTSRHLRKKHLEEKEHYFDLSLVSYILFAFLLLSLLLNWFFFTS